MTQEEEEKEIARKRNGKDKEKKVTKRTWKVYLRFVPTRTVALAMFL
jgi:hypothetical protein